MEAVEGAAGTIELAAIASLGADVVPALLFHRSSIAATRTDGAATLDVQRADGVSRPLQPMKTTTSVRAIRICVRRARCRYQARNHQMACLMTFSLSSQQIERYTLGVAASMASD